MLTPGYDKLSAEQRQERFLHAKGAAESSYVKYLDVATRYFRSSRDSSVISPKRPPDVSLYQEMTILIDFLRRQPIEKLTDEDERICDALLMEMSSGGDRPKTRQRLHHAIYGEHFPPYHDGIVAWHTLGLPRDQVKDEWRYLVNDVYNENLAYSFGLRSAQDFHPRQIRFERVFETEVDVQKAGLVRLASTIYPAYLSFDFVRKVRKQKQFWRNLSDPTLDPVVHRQFIAEEFAKHLIDQGRKDLAGEQWREKIVVPLKKARLALPPIAAALAFFYGLAKGSTVEMRVLPGVAGGATFTAVNLACRGIEDYFVTWGQAAGARWSYNADLKTFVKTAAEVAHVE